MSQLAPTPVSTEHAVGTDYVPSSSITLARTITIPIRFRFLSSNLNRMRTVIVQWYPNSDCNHPLPPSRLAPLGMMSTSGIMTNHLEGSLEPYGSGMRLDDVGNEHLEERSSVPSSGELEL